jgi:hypothetical protein
MIVNDNKIDVVSEDLLNNNNNATEFHFAGMKPYGFHK